MRLRNFFSLYPSRLLWVSFGIFFVFFCCGFLFFNSVVDRPFLSHLERRAQTNQQLGMPSSLRKSVQELSFDVPNLKGEICFFLSPLFPGKEESAPILNVQIKKGGASRSVALPARIDLSFNDFGNLEFQEQEGPFWVDLSLKEQNVLCVDVAILDETEIYRNSFSEFIDIPPIQKREDLPAGSPLIFLVEARWRGGDLLAQSVLETSVQRIEIVPYTHTIFPEEKLVFKEGVWTKQNTPEEGLPFAQIRSFSAQQLEWDTWDEKGMYRRIACPLQPIQTIPPKTEEVVNSVRIRSQKQISCMFEKQCLLLRIGDWVLKEQGKWHLIRTKEEKEKVLTGQKGGELFILEKIELKQKMVKGRLILPHRTQMVPMELTALTVKSDLKKKQKRNG